MTQRPYPTEPGWWELMNDFEQRAKALDPDIQLMYKEKYGTVQIDYCTERPEAFREVYKLTDEAEERSKTICEFCGRPGQLREQNAWLTTLCDRCAPLDHKERRKIAEETAERYFRGSHLRHEGPKDRSKLREIRLTDMLEQQEDAEDHALAMERLQTSSGKLITHEELTEELGIKPDKTNGDIEFE